MREEDFFAQDEWEFSQMLRYVSGRSMLEIGSRFGEGLKRMARCMEKGATIVSVDLCNDSNALGVDTKIHLENSAASLKAEGFDVHVILGDSHDDNVIKMVNGICVYDFCFIDGDHTTAGVEHDFSCYGKSSKIVGFHDICLPPVKKYWDRLKREYRHIEIINSNRLTPGRMDMGIGIIFTGN